MVRRNYVGGELGGPTGSKAGWIRATNSAEKETFFFVKIVRWKTRLSFWNGPFSKDMLVFWGEIWWEMIQDLTEVLLQMDCDS